MATAQRTSQELGTRSSAGCREFFLDLQKLRCGDGISAASIQKAFTPCPAIAFHLIGAPTEIRTPLTEDPRVTLHSDLASAWDQWA
ncbi:hypothetical protein [Streptomyces sp. NPDC046909]|uniref:hypothetical protein n=1 Tax=Streptomyces sp. NPDC046909 TaxID=3155617 RepID=UPI003403FFD2